MFSWKGSSFGILPESFLKDGALVIDRVTRPLRPQPDLFLSEGFVFPPEHPSCTDHRTSFAFCDSAQSRRCALLYRLGGCKVTRAWTPPEPPTDVPSWGAARRIQKLFYSLQCEFCAES